MPKVAAWLKGLLVYEPAVTAWATGGGLAAFLAWVLHFSRDQQAAAAVIITAAAAIVTALLAHPPKVPVITGALATIGAAAGAFGYHPSAHAIAVAQLVAGLALALLYRQNLEPKARVAERRKRAAHQSARM